MRKLSRGLLGLVTGGVLLLGLGVNTASAGPVIEVGDSGSLKIDYQVQMIGEMKDTGNGPDGKGDTDRFYFRRNRLSFMGSMNDSVGYTFQLENSGTDGTVGFLDGYLDLKASDALQVRAGKFKHIVSREVLEHCFVPLSADRTIYGLGPYAGKSTRDYGAVLWGNIANDKLQYRVAVLNGNENNYSGKRKDSFRYSGRVHLTLLDPENDYGYKGTYLGKKKVLTVGASYDMEKDAAFNSTTNDAKDYKAYSYDVFFEYPSAAGTITLSSAYSKYDFDKGGLNGYAEAQGVSGEKNGTYWKAGYMIGKVQFFGRYEDWTFANYGADNQNVKWTAGGINYYIKDSDLKLTAEYAKTDFSKETSSTQDFNTLTLMLQARF